MSKRECDHCLCFRGESKAELEALRKVERAAIEMRVCCHSSDVAEFDAALAELRKVREDG